ncbi:hypothetical protein HanHA300_Chr14g0525961 [Helianthus annuus]|nr:hypothetical protein HanHA300_Chr14g0525961 [Helianthus annuus]
MMIGRLDRKARPVLREKNDGHLGALGGPAATGVPKETALKFGDKRQRKKKTHEAVSVPPLVPEATCILRTRLRKYEDYVVCLTPLRVWVFQVLLRVRVDRLRALNLLMTRNGMQLPLLQVHVFATPPSSPKVVDVETQKKGGEDPSIEVVSSGDTPPSVHAEQASKKVAGERIFGTLDSSNNLIDPHDNGGQRGAKPTSPILEKNFWVCCLRQGSCGSASNSLGVFIELDYYYRSYVEERSFDFHRPPWNVLQGDDVLNDPSACTKILRGLGTPVETARARGLSRQNLQGQLASMLVGSSIIANAVMEDYNVLARREEETIRLRAEAEAMVKDAREGVEQLEREKAAFEKLKQTERWAASTGLEQVRTLAKLLSDERKLWKESCARENEKLFRVHQELNNLKAVNAALVKEKAATEAVAKEAETRGVTALKEVEARVA